jgi:hypothetical protein
MRCKFWLPPSHKKCFSSDRKPFWSVKSRGVLTFSWWTSFRGEQEGILPGGSMDQNIVEWRELDGSLREVTGGLVARWSSGLVVREWN